MREQILETPWLVAGVRGSVCPTGLLSWHIIWRDPTGLRSQGSQFVLYLLKGGGSVVVDFFWLNGDNWGGAHENQDICLMSGEKLDPCSKLEPLFEAGISWHEASFAGLKRNIFAYVNERSGFIIQKIIQEVNDKALKRRQSLVCV